MTIEQKLPAATYHEPSPSSDQAPPPAPYVNAEPSSSPGPAINGRPTTVTLLTPSQLAKHDLLPSFNETCNAAYRAVHIRSGILPPSLPRLPQADSILTAVGTAPENFTYVVHYADTNVVVGTVSLRRYYSVPLRAVQDGEADTNDASKTFDREGPVPEDTAAWETKLLTVGVDAQGQGLAVYLMGLGEAEAKRRFDADFAHAAVTGGKAPSRLLYVLNTIKQEFYGFYQKRGYSFDYEMTFPVGTLGSEKSFTIVHLSKHADGKA